MVTQAQVAHATRGRAALRMMVPVVLLILVRVAHVIQVLGALNTRVLVVLLILVRVGPDTQAQVGRHTMVPVAQHTTAQEALAILAPVDRVIPDREAQA